MNSHDQTSLGIKLRHRHIASGGGGGEQAEQRQRQQHTNINIVNDLPLCGFQLFPSPIVHQIIPSQRTIHFAPVTQSDPLEGHKLTLFDTE